MIDGLNRRILSRALLKLQKDTNNVLFSLGKIRRRNLYETSGNGASSIENSEIFVVMRFHGVEK